MEDLTTHSTPPNRAESAPHCSIEDIANQSEREWANAKPKPATDIGEGFELIAEANAKRLLPWGAKIRETPAVKLVRALLNQPGTVGRVNDQKERGSLVRAAKAMRVSLQFTRDRQDRLLVRLADEDRPKPGIGDILDLEEMVLWAAAEPQATNRVIERIVGGERYHAVQVYACIQTMIQDGVIESREGLIMSPPENAAALDRIREKLRAAGVVS